MNEFESFLRMPKSMQETLPFQRIILGSQGSGKTTMAMYVKSQLTSLKIEHKFAAYTGTAAHSIQGVTLHTLLGLRPSDNDFESIAKDSRRDVFLRGKLQGNFIHFKFHYQ